MRAGECIASIAFEHGFFPDTIWGHPENAALRDARRDPNVLRAGDEVVIPDKRSKTITCDTGRRHVFRRRGVPEQMKLRLLKHGEPRRGVRYVLEVGGARREGTTNDRGEIDVPIMPNASFGRIELIDTQEVYHLRIGELDPPEDVTGVQGRLANLGYYRGPIDGVMSDALRYALRVFQASEPGLAIDGELTDATRVALQQRCRG